MTADISVPIAGTGGLLKSDWVRRCSREPTPIPAARPSRVVACSYSGTLVVNGSLASAVTVNAGAYLEAQPRWAWPVAADAIEQDLLAVPQVSLDERERALRGVFEPAACSCGQADELALLDAYGRTHVMCRYRAVVAQDL